MTKNCEDEFKDALREVLLLHRPEYKDEGEIAIVVDEMAAVAIEGQNRYPRELPPRPSGHTQCATIGEMRIIIRTGNYADGSLGEVKADLSGHDDPDTRSLVQALAGAVTIGLQWGVPLDAFVDHFARDGEGSKVVSGHDDITTTGTVAGFVFKHLAGQYVVNHSVFDLMESTSNPLPQAPAKLRPKLRLVVNNGAAPKPRG